jgi:hypothetical protein
MAKDLVTLPKGTPPAKYDDEAFKASTQSGDWLPRLQLMTANSKECKGGDFPINHYAIIRDQNFNDLGKSVDILLIEWRPKAIEIDEQIYAVYDPEHEEFKRIQEMSNTPDSGCMYGPEFLVWIPAVEEYATFFMGSKSSRREASSVRALLRNAGTLKSKEISTAKYTWWSPIIEKCTSSFDLPSKEEIAEQYEKFINPPDPGIERAPEEDISKNGRAR